MSAARLPWPLALLDYLLPHEEALAGDLLEASSTHSRAWLWRQVLLAVPSRLAFEIRLHPGTSIAHAVVSTAMLAVMGFYTLVAATLMNRLLMLGGVSASVTGRYDGWQWLWMGPAFVAAVVLGRAMARLHCRHRVAVIALSSACATGVTFIHLFLFVPGVLRQPLVPSAAEQTAISMFFLAGLCAGITSRSRCEPLTSP